MSTVGVAEQPSRTWTSVPTTLTDTPAEWSPEELFYGAIFIMAVAGFLLTFLKGKPK
jgi:hypothetical protein|tara:strand:- start:980 stop:1150 length:171 start_codon:yes stop_codon:yes gene_type:complete